MWELLFVCFTSPALFAIITHRVMWHTIARKHEKGTKCEKGLIFGQNFGVLSEEYVNFIIGIML